MTSTHDRIAALEEATAAMAECAAAGSNIAADLCAALRDLTPPERQDDAAVAVARAHERLELLLEKQRAAEHLAFPRSNHNANR